MTFIVCITVTSVKLSKEFKKVPLIVEMLMAAATLV